MPSRLRAVSPGPWESDHVESESVRLAEVLAALAAATDLGMGQPAGHAVETALLSVRLARHFGLSRWCGG